MLKHNKNRLHGRVRGDISATLLIAQHAEFEVIDMIRHERCELIDLLVGDEEIAFGLEERERDAECIGKTSVSCRYLLPGEKVLLLPCVRWRRVLAGMALAAVLDGHVRCICLIQRIRCYCQGRSAAEEMESCDRRDECHLPMALDWCAPTGSWTWHIFESTISSVVPSPLLHSERSPGRVERILPRRFPLDSSSTSEQYKLDRSFSFKRTNLPDHHWAH